MDLIFFEITEFIISTSLISQNYRKKNNSAWNLEKTIFFNLKIYLSQLSIQNKNGSIRPSVQSKMPSIHPSNHLPLSIDPNPSIHFDSLIHQNNEPTNPNPGFDPTLNPPSEF